MKSFWIAILITLYSTLLEILRHTVVPLLLGVSKKRGWNLAERQKLPYAVRDYRNRTVVWVHAASLGEAKLLYQFLEILTHRYPEDLYVATATTASGVDYLNRNRPQSVCAVGFLPIDTIPLVKSLLNKFSIKRLWLMETELWPAMLWTCKQNGISIGIANARIEERSYSSYVRLKNIVKPLFESFDIVFAQNDNYASRFIELGVKPGSLHVVGNIKSFIHIKRPVRDEWLAIRNEMNVSENSFVITAGCIHPGEGMIIRRATEMLNQKGHACKCIIVPRHLESVKSIADEVGKSVVILDDIKTSKYWDICIVDKLGVLEDMYKIADVAFIGGTFVNVGGHNVWDAARFGVPVFFGPDYHTQIEGCEKLMTAGVGFKTENAEDLASHIYKVVKKDARKFISAQTLFMETINKRQSVIEPLIP